MDDLDVDVVAKPKLKTSRFAPKLKGKQLVEAPKPEIPKPEPIEIDSKPLTSISDPLLKNCEIKKEAEVNGKDDWMELDVNDGDLGEMEIDEREDDIIEEFDVFLNESPLEDGASIYVMQYPLRPPWHPYELDEKCVEVRMKPKLSKLEVDFSLDIDSRNYNREAPMMLKTQTLASHMWTPNSTFAVGIRKGKQFHLSPVDSIMQFRPSVAKLIDEEKKLQLMDNNTKPSEGKAVAASASECLEDDEPWVPLEYHPFDSSFSNDYRRKMEAVNDADIQSCATESEYVDSLFPTASRFQRSLDLGSPPLSMPLEERTKKELLSMSLEDRMKKWLSEGPQINRFVSLLYLAPDDTVENVLRVLQQHAYLVQGLWVAKSSLLYEGFEAFARDYILSQFSKHRIIRYDKKKVPPDYARKILAKIAVQRSILQDWKFKEDTDTSFIKSYPHIVKEQEHAWSDRMDHIMSSVRGVGKIREKQQMNILINSLNPHLQKKTSDIKEDDNPQNIDKMAPSMDRPVLTREELKKAIKDISKLQGVWSLEAIVKELNGKVSGPTPELQSVLSEVAVSIHGKYVLKSQNSTLDLIRIMLCKTFLEMQPNAKIKEQDIETMKRMVQKKFKKDIDSEFNQAVSELFISIPGGLQFRNGDRVKK